MTRGRPRATYEPENFWRRVSVGEPSDCWPWLRARIPGGYGSVLWDGRIQGTHRVAYQLAEGTIPSGQCVLHTCDNPPCCNPQHLYLGTRVENNADRDRKGRHRALRGEANGNARLADADRTELVRLWCEARPTKTALAQQFGVSRRTIGRVLSGGH